MFNLIEFEKAGQIFAEAGAQNYSGHHGQHHLSCRPKELIRWVELLKDDMGFLVLTDIVGLDHLNAGRNYRFELVYQFLNMGTHQRLNLHLLFDESEVVPSLSDFYFHAAWAEREQAEMFGIRFDYEPEALLLPKKQKNWPLRKDARIQNWPVEETPELPKPRINPNKSEAPYPEESYIWKSHGLLSSLTGGNFEWNVCLSPEEVVAGDLRIGFHHSGFEKLLESKDWLQVMHLIDTLHSGASPTMGVLWSRSLEDIFDIRLPERGQAIRMVMLELARIAEHLTVLAEICQAEKRNEYLLFLDAREKVFELFEKFCGHRQGFGFVCLGGVKEDIPPGWIVQYQEAHSLLQNSLELINKSLLADSSYRANLMGPSIDAQTILKNAVSGPAMRASGLNFDLRKSHPFYFYQDVDFDIPVGIYGTTFDRYLIRFEEIRQSFRIITQVIDNLPLGDIVAPAAQLSPLEVIAEMTKTSSATFHAGFQEAPGGELGISLAMSEGNKLTRVKLKSPSFTLAQAVPDLALGLKESQLPAFVASLGIRRFELDR